jgi:simple sugar transport system permease protein
MNIVASRHIPLIATAAVLAVLFGAASLSFENFCSPFVISDLFSENAFLGISAIGMTLVILSGGIDLSVGAVIGFTTIFVATLITGHNVSPWLAWTTALGIGTFFGAAMGATIHFFKLPAFLVTLAGLFFARGMAFCVTQQSVQIRNDTYEWVSGIAIPLGDAELGFTTMLLLLLLVLMAAIANFTSLGRNVFAIGGSEESALLMGLPVARTKVAVYAINGFCSALAGIVMTLYMDSGNPINAIGLELDVIAVVVIGGTLLSGGVGNFSGTLLGFLIYGTIYQITYFANVGSSVATIAIGGLLLAFILLQRLLVR